MNTREVAAFIEQLAPLETAVLGDVNGFMFGHGDTEVRGIAVCWSPTLEVIQESITQGLSLIVCHEIPFFYHSDSPWLHNARTECKRANLERIKLLSKHGMCVYRTHSNWDVAPGHGNCDAFGEALGFVHEIARGRLSRVYQVPPTSVKQLARHVKQRMRLDVVRVAGDPSTVVTRVGTGCGGLGQLFNYPEELAALGAEVAIMGEVIDYTIRHALELGLALIETSHIGSENYGLENLADLLQHQFPNLRVMFLDSGTPWVWL